MSLKIIIAYATSGSGHRRAAEAISDYLKDNYPLINISLVNILDYTNFLFANSYPRIYYLLVAHLRFIWAIIYHLSNFKYVSWFLKFISRLNCQRFINLLIKEKPDVILATHFLPAEVVAHLKQKDRLKTKLITVITDFDLHSLWIFENCDEYIVGSQLTCDRLASRGIKQDKIRVMGIPVDSGFSARYQEDIKKENLRALLITGSFGFSSIKKVVDLLYTEINLFVVCGHNQRLYDRLVSKCYAGVRVFGFVEDMPSLMSQADIVITKPGGLTIAEALSMQKPLIFINSIPGQEKNNARILESFGCAIYAKNITSLKSIVIDLKTHPEKINLIKTNIKKFRKPNATEKICQNIIQYVRSGSI